VLASAAPSLESYFAARTGTYKLVEIKGTRKGPVIPEIHVVDMRKQLELQGNLPLSVPLRDALTERLKKNERALLLLNRRGFSRRRICSNCGETAVCPHCLAPLVPHIRQKAILCHYCGYQESSAFTCKSCGEEEFYDAGLAIEKLEDYLNKIYPDAGIVRLDRDSIKKPEGIDAALLEFRSGKAGILLGTQMAAKGRDFITAPLVGVIDADTGLGIPDFRAQERIFQLIVQVSGTAESLSGPGEVYIQTFNPENPALRHALNFDYQGFYESELKIRQELNYPPVSRMFKVEISGKEEKKVHGEMSRFARILKEYADQAGILLLGPGLAPRKKVRGQYRCQVFGKGRDAAKLQWALKQSLAEYSPASRRQVKMNVDVDPVSVM
jgi:primosomal protein N' (replication factor Y)